MTWRKFTSICYAQYFSIVCWRRYSTKYLHLLLITWCKTVWSRERLFDVVDSCISSVCIVYPHVHLARLSRCVREGRVREDHAKYISRYMSLTREPTPSPTASRPHTHSPFGGLYMLLHLIMSSTNFLIESKLSNCFPLLRIPLYESVYRGGLSERAFLVMEDDLFFTTSGNNWELFGETLLTYLKGIYWINCN